MELKFKKSVGKKASCVRLRNDENSDAGNTYARYVLLSYGLLVSWYSL